MAEMSEITLEQRKGPHRFEPGNEWAFKPGNPGRPRGSRNKLADEFITDLLNDWQQNGKQAIVDMREESPTNYCKVVAAVIPKEVNHTVEDYDQYSDDELAAEFARIAIRLSARNADRSGDRAQGEQAALSN